MNRLYFAIGLSAFSVFLAGCQKNQPVVETGRRDSGSIEKVSLILSPFEEDDMQSRTSYDFANRQFLWSEGDAVGIVNEQGGHLKFLIKEDYYGSTKASFDGRGYALLPGVNYAGYSPFYPDYDLDPTHLPISYKGQVQQGNDDQSHLGSHSYIAAIGSAPETGSLNFKFKNIGSPHRYNVPVTPGDYTVFRLYVQEPKYILEGTINLMSPDEASLIAIAPVELSNEISLDLTGTTVSEAGILSCWMMVPPADLSGDIIRMTLTKEDGTVLLAVAPGRDCPANNRRFFYPQSSVSPASRDVGSGAGRVEVQVARASAEVDLTVESQVEWLSLSSSSTSGLVTTYTFDVAENTGSEREGTISFTETSTGLANTVKVTQKKAGTVIGIGGWDSENRSGRAN